MQKLIYLVDDEPSVLDMLGVFLRSIDPSWKVTEFSKPSELLAAVQKQPPHVILSDHEMPEMTGSALLDQIRKLSPTTVRIIISSQVVRLEKLGVAHQHLSKLCSLEELEVCIRNALSAQGVLENADLARLVSSLTSFPVLPSVFTDLMRELDNDEAAVDRTADLLKRDGGILTKVIHAANSPLFRGMAAVTDSRAALLQLGTRNVKALVLSMHIFEGYESVYFPDMPVDKLWHHSCSTARLAQEICRPALGDEVAHEAFFSGLVHDLGCLILMENQPEAFRKLCQRAELERKPLHQAEQEAFHVTHEEISAFMLRLWGLGDPVVNAVMYHNAPWEALNATSFSPTVALYMANIFTRREEPPDRLVTPDLDEEYLSDTGAPPIPSVNPAERRRY
jgi:HD-like signal output (HDOD) protein